MNQGLVVVVLISDWIKLYSGYNCHQSSDPAHIPSHPSIKTCNSIELQFSGLEQYYGGFITRGDVIGASRSTVVNTSVNNIGSITDMIINCNTPVDNNGNILSRYASSQSIIRINTTKLMYVSTTIGYNSVGSNNDMITCSSVTPQHEYYVPMGITYTDRIGSERSATLNSSYTHIDGAMNSHIELIGSDKNIIKNGVYVRPSLCANGSRSSNANQQQQTEDTYVVISTTGRDNEDGERELIPDVNADTIVLSSTTSTFEEPIINDDTAPTTKNYIGVMIVINIKIMGSNCLVTLRLKRKSHGLWRTTRTYQWRYSWYKLDGRGVTGFCAAESGDTHPIGVGLMTKVHQGIMSL